MSLNQTPDRCEEGWTFLQAGQCHALRFVTFELSKYRLWNSRRHFVAVVKRACIKNWPTAAERIVNLPQSSALHMAADLARHSVTNSFVRY
jgi:hypothetical protein